jgi:hypothetical protein
VEAPLNGGVSRLETNREVHIVFGGRCGRCAFGYARGGAVNARHVHAHAREVIGQKGRAEKGCVKEGEKEEPVSEEGSGPEKNVIGPIAWCKAES